MLKEPRPQYIGGHLREDAPFLLVLFTVRVVIFLPRSLSRPDTRITGVSYERNAYINIIFNSFPNVQNF